MVPSEIQLSGSEYATKIRNLANLLGRLGGSTPNPPVEALKELPFLANKVGAAIAGEGEDRAVSCLLRIEGCALIFDLNVDMILQRAPAMSLA